MHLIEVRGARAGSPLPAGFGSMSRRARSQAPYQLHITIENLLRVITGSEIARAGQTGVEATIRAVGCANH